MVMLLVQRSWTTLVPLMNMATLELHKYCTNVVALSTSVFQGITCLNSTFCRYCWPAGAAKAGLGVTFLAAAVELDGHIQELVPQYWQGEELRHNL